MMTFLPSFFFDLSATQAAPDTASPSPTEKSSESTDSEFAALFAMLWLAPPALPVEKAVTDANSITREETANIEAVAADSVPDKVNIPTTVNSNNYQPSLLGEPPIFALEEMIQQNSDDVISDAKALIKNLTGFESDESIEYMLKEPPTNVVLPDRPERGPLVAKVPATKALTEILTEIKTVESNPIHIEQIDQGQARSTEIRPAILRIDSLVSPKTDATAVTITATRDRLDKKRFPPIDLDEAVRYEGRNEKELKGSVLEVAFRDIIGAKPEIRHEESVLRDAFIKPILKTNDGLPFADEDYTQPEASSQTDAAPLTASTGSIASPQEQTEPTPLSTLRAVTQQVVNPIIDIAKRLAQRETRTLRIELQPERFGHIDVKVTRNADGQLSAYLVADLDVAHQALSEGMNHLRRTLEQSGLAVDQLEVTLSLNAGGNSGSHTSREGAVPTHFSSFGLFSSDVAIEDKDHSTDDERSRLLSLRI